MARFKLNPRLEAQIGASAELRRVLEDKADVVVEEARRIAASEAYETGAYMRSIHAEGGRIIADDEAAIYVEFGTRRQRPKAVLRRALERARGDS